MRDIEDRLVQAAETGDRDAVQRALDAGADVHARAEKALQRAAANGHGDTVAVLLAHGADVHVRNETPLQSAAIVGHVDTVALLLDRGARYNTADAALASAHEHEARAFLKEQYAQFLARQAAALAHRADGVAPRPGGSDGAGHDAGLGI